MKEERIALKQVLNFNNRLNQFDGNEPNRQKKPFNLVTEAYEESHLIEKQNQSLQCSKKLRLKLKTNPSKQLERKTEAKHLLKHQASINEKIQPDRIKNVDKRAQNAVIQNGKRKIGSNFKPNVVYFQLKTLKGGPNSNILTNKPNEELKQKEKPKVKNYQLSSFLSQVLSKFAQIYPSILNHEPNLKVLSSQQICYSDMTAMLFSLGMITHSSEEKYKIENQDQKNQLQKVYLLWKILKSNLSLVQSGQQIPSIINLINLAILLAAIVNVNFDNAEEFVNSLMEKMHYLSTKETKHHKNILSDNPRFHEPNHIFFIRNKILLKRFQITQYQNFSLLNLSQQVKSQITKEFQLFRVNRLKLQNCPKTNNENLQIEIKQSECTIQSLLSPKSHQLAMTRRLKILEEIHNSQDKSLTKQQLDLNLFLSYKKSQNYTNQIKPPVSKELLRKQVKQKKQEKNVTKQKNDMICKNGFIPSQRIKFSELNVIRNMQKARKTKQQTQLILQTGWTNSGQLSSKASKLIKNQQIKLSSKEVELEAKSKEKSKSLGKSSQLRRNWMEGRKYQMKTGENYGKNYQSPEISLKQKIFNEKKKAYEKQEELIEEMENGKDTFIRHSSELDSDDTISIDENQSIVLENKYFSHEDDFLIEHNEPFETINQANPPEPSHKQTNLPQENLYEPESSSKTFATQVNQDIEPQDSASATKKPPSSNRQSTQARVIKSYLKIPILYVDVNMDESKKERIIIYEEDDPINLAQQFGIKHGLDELMVQRLQQMLKEQISGILGRIDQEEEDESDDASENTNKERK